MPQIDESMQSSAWCRSSGVPNLCEGGLIQKASMDLVNDPRFFTPNVIDKRLSALTALSIVCGIMAGAAVDQCFALRKNFVLFSGSWYSFNLFGWIQFVGFAVMCMVLVMNVFTTLIFGLQLFFTFRLMTAGPAGFESAKAFYLHPRTTYWRQLSATYLMKGMPLFVLSVGAMLFTKTRIENVTDTLHIVAWICLGFFTFSSLFLFSVCRQHQAAFDDKYQVGFENLKPLMTAMQAKADDLDEVSVLC